MRDPVLDTLLARVQALETRLNALERPKKSKAQKDEAHGDSAN
jgi:BMFP domain-containing protein YqiC